MFRTKLYADPGGVFVHDLVARAALRFGEATAIVDTSCSPLRRLSFADYADIVERLARGFVSAGVQPGDVIAIFLPNSWEFAATYHATTLAGGIPTLLNPTYREREVRYQLENSGAAILVTQGAILGDINLTGLHNLRRQHTKLSNQLSEVTARLASLTSSIENATIAKWSGSNPSTIRLYSAGRSLR